MPDTTCVHVGCTKDAFSRGRCGAHYKQDRKNGALPKITEADRFWTKVDKGAGCWAWAGSYRRDGYGQFQFRGSNSAAHRASWTIHNGPIPDGMFIDHICHNKSCVRPDHLRLATVRQNNEYRQGPNSNNRSSGIRGVTYDKSRDQWVGQVLRNRKYLFVKRFATKEEAEAAVKEARAKFFDFPEAA